MRQWSHIYYLNLDIQILVVLGLHRARVVSFAKDTLWFTDDHLRISLAGASSADTLVVERTSLNLRPGAPPGAWSVVPSFTTDARPSDGEGAAVEQKRGDNGPKRPLGAYPTWINSWLRWHLLRGHFHRDETPNNLWPSVEEAEIACAARCEDMSCHVQMCVRRFPPARAAHFSRWSRRIHAGHDAFAPWAVRLGRREQ